MSCQEFRTEMNERKEMLALNRHRYDELIQLTNKASMVGENSRSKFFTHFSQFHEQAANVLQQFRSTRSTSSTLIDQVLIDCRSIGENLQGNLQRINDDIRTIFGNCSRSIGKYRER